MKHFVAKSGIAVITMAAALGAVFGIGLSVPAFAQQPFVDKLVLDDTIQPVSADEVTRALDRANSDGASALLIEINTPGGLLDSMRDMVGGILRSRVPVIVYVGPSGARASETANKSSNAAFSANTRPSSSVITTGLGIPVIHAYASFVRAARSTRLSIPPVWADSSLSRQAPA